MNSKALPRIAAAVVFLFAVALFLLATPHAKSVFRMVRDLTQVDRFQRTIGSPEFKARCPGWEKKGLSDCLIREVEAQGLLVDATSARRVMLHGAVVSSLGKAYRDQWDSRYRAYSDAVFFLIHDLAHEEKRAGKIIAFTQHDPAADQVFHPARVEEAEERSMKSLNGRLWNTYRDRTQRMKDQGVSENLDVAQRERLNAAYALMENWEKRIRWQKP